MKVLSQSIKKYCADLKSPDVAEIIFSNLLESPEYIFSSKVYAQEIIDSILVNVNLFDGSTPFLFKFSRLQNGNIVHVMVMKDRPFVVDSVTNFLTNADIAPSLFLHPNFFVGGKNLPSLSGNTRLSVIVFETKEPLTVQNIEEMHQVLTHLTLVTDDFSKMVDLAESLDLTKNAKEFISWLVDGSLVFLGMSSSNGNKLGICKLPEYNTIVRPNGDISCHKTILISKVHANTEITIISTSVGGNIYNIYGMFTTYAHKADISRIPLLKDRISSIFNYADFSSNASYNQKECISFLENLPREELFLADDATLADAALSYIQSLSTSSASVYANASDDILTIITIIPNGNFAPRMSRFVKKTIENTFKSKVVFHSIINSFNIRGTVIKTLIQSENIDNNVIQNCIIDIKKGCIPFFNSITAPNLGLYKLAMTAAYVAENTPKQAERDIIIVEEFISSNEEYHFEINAPVFVITESGKVEIRIYSNQAPELHGFIKIFDHFNVTITDFQVYEIALEKPMFVTSVIAKLENSVTIDSLKSSKFISVLNEILSMNRKSIKLNRLSITANLEYKHIYILRSLVKYCKQIAFSFSEIAIQKSLNVNPVVSKLLIDLFYAKFDPEMQDRNARISSIMINIESELAKIKNISDDKVLRAFYTIINAIVRTNFFLQQSNQYIVSYKMACSKMLDILPKPVPMFEIFVYSQDFEAVHLRFGKVARGGLRWSDRHEDFRTEVLGLVKAQNTKNAVIVPLGSKGGFVIKKSVVGLSKEEAFEFGRECYKKFLSACLDITDNIISGETTHPTNVVCHDENDPYFVVAADKGTATFSDTANAISAKYNFWLGDAFASGGSKGYDHKQMGITAKGAWIAARRHFMEMGKNVDKESFICVGIGDLSGDVFGNGMIISSNMKLVAAFNHMHIFVDPNPDMETSYIERKRMFALPRSSWMDYDTSVISKGGAIFERSAKSCILTPEIKAAFGINSDSLSPNDLIKVLLQSKVDLIWNGGIGTYIKAIGETHAQAGDKANDEVRINGKEMRAKIFAEGGNLGATQNGRIEYAMSGGRINTDAMDNSAGVNCSDNEVNIKILLNSLVKNGSFAESDRDAILLEMTDEVERLVLRNNYLQTQAISVTARWGSVRLEHQNRLMQALEDSGVLDRANEFLPSRDEIKRRKNEGIALTRPELCVLFAYSKIFLYSELLESKLLDEKYFDNDLISYFPKQMQAKFANELQSHPLRREIIATQVNNSIVNRAGITFVNNITSELVCKPCDVVRGYIVVREMFDICSIWKIIESFDFIVSAKLQTDLFVTINKHIERTVYFMLRSKNTLAITEILVKMSTIVDILRENLSSIAGERFLANISAKELEFIESGIAKDDAYKIAFFLELISISCLIFESFEEKNWLEIVKSFFDIQNDIDFASIVNLMSSLNENDYWGRVAVRMLNERLFTVYVGIAKMAAGDTAKWRSSYKKQIADMSQFVSEVSDKPDFAIMTILVDKLQSLFR